jgi:acyl-CoA thioesterase-2
MPQSPLDLSGVFELEAHGSDTFLGESPAYSWGRIYGGLVIAQSLWAATQTVQPEHSVHSLHAYFILGGDPAEPVRYEVDRVRNGRSFSTRRVVARQSAGAILTLGCSFQAAEDGPESQSFDFPDDVPSPESLKQEWDAGVDRRDAKLPKHPPRSWTWARYPGPLGDDPRLHACALAYLSDLNPMSAVGACHPEELTEKDWEWLMGVSLDHAMWFQRPVRADDWVLMDLHGHGLIRTRGLATGPAFMPDGTHAATIAQECLLRDRRKRG